MQTFLQFVAEREQNIIHAGQLNEAFKEEDVKRANKLIDNILAKHINNLVPLKGYMLNTVNNQKVTSKQYLILNKKNWSESKILQFNWLNRDKSTEVYSIDFFDSLDLLWGGKDKSKLSIYTMGSSIVYFLPIIWTVINNGNYDITQQEAINIGRTIYKSNIKESKYYVGALEYIVYEGLSDTVIEDTFNINVNENGRDDVIKYKKEKHKEAQDAYAKRNDSPEAKQRYKDIDAEYKAIVKAIKGGADNMLKLKLALKRDIQVIEDTDKSIIQAEEKLEQEKKSPEQVFKEMQKYVKMVITGLQPLVIICGAPGVGKTYRIKQQLKANGYIEGKNRCTFTGRGGAQGLFTAMYNFREKGDIILVDDCDSLLLDDNAINIIKGATDSTEEDGGGRLISYAIRGKLFDLEGDEVPKKFLYRGSMIILTNLNAGQLDTAVKGRAFVQDIHFTVEDTLQVIKSLMPVIEPNKFTMKNKVKAYEYLEELAKDSSTAVDISVRVFGNCAKIFQAADDDGTDEFTEEDAKSMIKDQMKLQAARGGKRY